MTNVYFVYSYTDPRNNELFYIGMGKGKRHLSHLKEAKSYGASLKNKNVEKIKKILSIINEGQLPIIQIIDDGLSADVAAELEKFLISFIGRKIKGDGTLLNLSPGGKSGWPLVQPENRKKIYESVYGNTEKMAKKICDTRKTCELRYGVSSYQKTREFKENARTVFKNLYEKGEHWVQNNKDTISKNTLKQAEEGRHPFQTLEYRERKRKECIEKNAAMNRAKASRKNVEELKALYVKHSLKQPKGGIWVKNDEWINSEIQRLTSINNPFGDL